MRKIKFIEGKYNNETIQQWKKTNYQKYALK